MKAATPSPRGLGKRSKGDSRACRPHRCARVRGGAHGQLPGGEGAHGQGKEQRQEVRGEKGETKEVTCATAFSKKQRSRFAVKSTPTSNVRYFLLSTINSQPSTSSW